MKEIQEQEFTQLSQIQVNVLQTDTTITLGFGGTATNPTDYTVDSTTITISDNETSGFTRLNILGDTDYEDNETIIVDITNVTGGDGATESGTQQRTVTIVNDDPQILVDVSMILTTVTEGDTGYQDVTITATQKQAAATNTTVTFSTTGVPTDARYIIRDTKLYERLRVGIKFNYNHWFNNRFNQTKSIW